MKKLLLILLLPLLLIASCGTRKERAERLVKRANRLYPIDSLVSEKIVIDTLLKYDTTIVVQHDSAKISLPVYDIKSNKPIIYKKSIILNNNRATISATTNSLGGIDLDILFKEQKIRVQGTIKYKKEIEIHRRVITIRYYIKGFFWWTGLVTIGLIALYSGFKIYRLIKPKL